MIKRRKFIRIVSYLVSVSVIIGVAGIFSGRAKASYEETLGKMRFEALNSLCEYVYEIGSGLKILSVSQGDAIDDSTAYVESRVLGARGCISCFNIEKIANISRFLDAVYEISQDFSGDGKSRERASELSDYAEGLYYHLSDLSSAVMGGEYLLAEYGSVYSALKKPYFEDYLDYSGGNELFGSAESVSANGRFEILKGEKTVSAESAKKTASGITGVDEVLWRDCVKEGNGVEVYSLSHGDCEVEITKSGGKVMKIINPMPCKERVYTFDDAVLKAEKFARNNGFASAELLGGRLNDFTADLRFVPSVNGVLLMTAPIDVSVCLSSGEITFFDASEYIENFRSNVYAEAEVPDLTDVLSDKLTAEKTAVCIADIKGGERLCYLAVCPFDDGELWVYIDYAEFRVIKMQKSPFTD